jgi:hypothetical protein
VREEVKVEQERKFSGKSTTSYKMVIVDLVNYEKRRSSKTYAIDNSLLGYETAPYKGSWPE